ncbi:MAG: hypothetical protein ACI3VK_06520 [Oscillospiraceae bacterium]
MKLKIPEIKIPAIKKHRAEENAPLDNADEILDELGRADPDNYTEQPAQPIAESKSPSFTVSEGQLRKIWAGEIAFGILASFAAVIIAFAG